MISAESSKEEGYGWRVKPVKFKPFKITKSLLPDNIMEETETHERDLQTENPQADSTLTIRVGSEEICCAVPSVVEKWLAEHKVEDGWSITASLRDVSESEENSASISVRPHNPSTQRGDGSHQKPPVVVRDMSPEKESAREVIGEWFWIIAYLLGIVIGTIIN